METKISLNPTPDNTQDIQPLLTHSVLINASVTVEIADLPGTAVAQTTGQTITLDNNAAGHNWFIDATPADNAEFLPTSNPNQWIAKAGSDAAGKMDLLSVLLHEYGHALGIEHSADGNDFMAATLQPGVRRLPSSDELTLMAQLASQARFALDGLARASSFAATPGGDALYGYNGSPDAPNPALPLGALGFALFGRIRRTDYGAWTVQAESAQLLPQYQIAINPTLQNGDPLALDDSITTDEDTPVTLAPLANDLLQTGETSALEVTNQPAHGVLTQNLDGTFATRLRATGVDKEDRSALLGHAASSMVEHYAAADIARLIELSNRVLERKGTRTILMVANGR